MRAQHASCAGKRRLPGRWRLNLRKAGGPEESAASTEMFGRKGRTATGSTFLPRTTVASKYKRRNLAKPSVEWLPTAYPSF